CNGGSNGSATVTVTGGTGAYRYLWSPSGGTAATASGLAAGNYTVTVKDANNCQKTANVTIEQPSALIASAAAQTNVSCNGGTNGSATVSVTGGTGAYTYLWSPSGGTAATASGLAAG
ncbi:SprB repeat-containing protein, partial [Priestia sp. SIMBA_032]|uniref:SprB repeat-containing protein n=1 Tax=Priestia sp. SIMBA_032 TaxID=3085775 RepID=UPI00397E2B8A